MAVLLPALNVRCRAARLRSPIELAPMELRARYYSLRAWFDLSVVTKKAFGTSLASKVPAIAKSGFLSSEGTPTAGGLWALGVGSGANNGFPNTLFFTDGINGEGDGLFGSLVFATNGVSPVTGVPEPSTWAMMLLGPLIS